MLRWRDSVRHRVSQVPTLLYLFPLDAFICVYLAFICGQDALVLSSRKQRGKVGNEHGAPGFRSQRGAVEFEGILGARPQRADARVDEVQPVLHEQARDRREQARAIRDES